MFPKPRTINAFVALAAFTYLGLLTGLTLFLAAEPPPAEPPPAEPSPAEPPPAKDVLHRILAEAQDPVAYDEPAAAERYYAGQRFPDGTSDADPVALYTEALAQRDRLPRYSVRRGVQLDDPTKAGELGTWEHLGPGNIGGRTRALVVHPRQPRIRWAAGVSGGIWKTTDGGRRWRPVADLLPNIAVNTLVLHPDNPNILYAGTGEGFFREEVRETSLPLRGAGIFKTMDGGRRWTRLDATLAGDFRWVNDIVISHGDPRRLYAATRTGVWRSRNAGATWTKSLAVDVKGGCLDLALRTDRRGDVVLASCGTFEQATVYRNQRAHGDGTWEATLTEPGMGRTSLALAPSQQGVAYALSASYLPGPGGNFQGGLHAVFRSDLNGMAGSWRAVVRNDDPVKLNTLLLSNPYAATLVECNQSTGNFYSTLGWYTNVIAVDPIDPDVVFAGGVDLFRSDDGGSTWGPITYWWSSPPSAHADQHRLVFHPGYDGDANQIAFLAGDGGVWVTARARAPRSTAADAPCDPANSAVIWNSLNNNYGITQFYHGAVFPDGRGYFGGTQDNGTLMGRDPRGVDGWFRILGGDGGYVAIDPRDPDVLYGESQHLGLRKSTDGGATWQRVIDGITDPASGPGPDNNGDFLFIVPFTLDTNHPDRLYLGGRRLWRTNNGAASWTPVSTRWPSGGRVSAVAVAPGDPNRVVVGLNDGTIHTSSDALASNEGTAWRSARPRAGFVSWLAFDPANPRRVYATYATFGGRHVWASADGGVSWTPIDGDGRRRLPNVPVHTIVADPGDPSRLFVGTDIGVFVSTNRGRRWAVENTGFAAAVTETLVVNTDRNGSHQLFAFTHGRGVWRVEMR